MSNKDEFNFRMDLAKAIIGGAPERLIGGEHPIYSYMKPITDYLTMEIYGYSKPERRLTFENLNALKKILRLLEVEDRIEFISTGVTTVPHASVKRPGDKIYPEKLFVDLQTTPILLNPWNKERGHENVSKFSEGKELFDASHKNIINHYYYPLGFIWCESGNHSQFAARLCGAAQTQVTEIINVEKLLSMVHFDGERFTYQHIAGFEDLDTTGFAPNNKFEFYIGLLIEIGRLIAEDKERIIPVEVQRVVDGAEAV